MQTNYSTKSFFVYESEIYDFNGLSLPPAPTAQLTFNTHGDSDFFWQKFAVQALSYYSVANVGEATTRGEPDWASNPLGQGGIGDGDYLATLAFSLTNSTTGRSLSAVPIGLPNVDGYLQFQDVPMVWPKKSSININITQEGVVPIPAGSATGGFYVIHFSFLGTKAFH